LVEVVAWNLLGYSEEFNNAAWAKTNATITANSTTAPNGTTTADTIASNSVGNDFVSQVPAFPSGVAGTFSVNLKNINSVITRFMVRGTVTAMEAQINWSGSILSSITLVQGISASFVDVGNGWYKITVAYTSSETNQPVRIYPDNANGGKSIYAWGAQLNIGSTAKPYFPTTDRLNVPRLTYQNGGGGCPSLLLEKQSTNLALWSEDFTKSDWLTSGASVTANNIISPDGTQNADSIEFTNPSYAAIYQSSLTTSGATYTASVYAKKGNQNFLGLEIRGAGSSPDAIFNLNTGVVVSGTGTIESVGNGWYKCSISKAANSASTLFIIGRGNSGGTTDTLYLWGAQFEQSSYATSYINTTTASATRVADLSATSTIQTAQTFAGDFTIFADFVPFIGASNADGLMILGGGVGGSGVSYQSYLWFVSNVVNLSGDGETQIILRNYSMVANERVKVAITRVGTTVKMFINGAQVGASATSSTSITIRSLGWSYNLATYRTQGKINQILLSASGASDTDAISLTTI
jgi:hypothetical protein